VTLLAALLREDYVLVGADAMQTVLAEEIGPGLVAVSNAPTDKFQQSAPDQPLMYGVIDVAAGIEPFRWWLQEEPTDSDWQTFGPRASENAARIRGEWRQHLVASYGGALDLSNPAVLWHTFSVVLAGFRNGRPGILHLVDASVPEYFFDFEPHFFGPAGASGFVAWKTAEKFAARSLAEPKAFKAALTEICLYTEGLHAPAKAWKITKDGRCEGV